MTEGGGRDAIIGIDAGTSMIKAVAFDLDGAQIAAHAAPNRYRTLPGGGAVQDMAWTWDETAAVLRGLLERNPGLGGRAAALAVTGQGDGTWLIDAAGAPVGPAWLWLDARAAGIVDALRAGPADAARYAINGCGLAACQQGPQLLWMRARAPALIARAATAMHCKDWLYFNLTGERATDPSEGCFSFGGYRDRAYSDAVIEALDLRDCKRLLPPMIDGARETAPLCAQGAAATGLPRGLPVALGHVDVVCTALGAGLLAPAEGARGGAGCSVVGSTGMQMRLARGADAVALTPERTGYVMLLPVPGAYAQMQSNMAATLNIDWLLDLAIEVLADQGVTRTRADLIPMLDDKVAAAAPARMLFQPYVSEAGERGPFVEPAARAGFVGLNAGHGFGDLMRGVYEGLAFAARDCFDAMGGAPGELRLTGGAARSAALRRIFAAALGAGVRVSARAEAGAAGAAMMASAAIGASDGVEPCAATWATPLLGDLEPPDPALAAIYDETYPAYLAARAALRPVWKTLADRAGSDA